MSQDGLASFEPAFADELAIVMAWAFDYLQRDGRAIPTNAHGCATRPAARFTFASAPVRLSSRAANQTHISPKR
ncbi:hypothetical protein AJ88_28545 [Mesorhizobium amorphae CCBAU 01583]|nr:hypothetical protein AJ88_28545 [Mesorhizobium amorphae CCBAU 01583]